MPRYADSDKEKVREGVDMVDLVSKRTELRRASPGDYKGLCPFHDERTPSFHVTPDKGMYYCFGCGAGGDAFKFVQETEGVDFVGAMESLAQRYGIELTLEDEDPAAAERRKARERLLELLERATNFYERYLWESTEAEPARAYLRDRGFTEETLRTFRVGYAPSAWDKLMMAGRQGGYGNKEIFDAGLVVRAKGEGRIYDRFRRRIMFPLCDPRGRVLGFGARALGADQQPKYLNSPDGDIFHKGEIVYGTHLARSASTRADEVVATEGYMDVLALHQAGMANVVCIMGTSMTDKQVGELAKLGKTVLLALDADSAGQEAMLKAAKVAAKSQLSLRVVPLPKGLDPADVVQQQGVEAAKALVGRSVPFVRFQVERELDRADLTEAEGKDAAIAALRPVFATLPPSALREELLDVVAEQVRLDRAKISSWLGEPLRAQQSIPSAPRAPAQSSREPRPPSKPGSEVARAERAFLAQCLITPAAAPELLDALNLDEFCSPFMCRLAKHVREHLDDPRAGIGDEDDDLRRAVEGLIYDTRELSASAVVLRRELANVELKRLKRAHQEAIAMANGTATGLRLKVDQANERWQALISQSLEESPIAS